MEPLIKQRLEGRVSCEHTHIHTHARVSGNILQNPCSFRGNSSLCSVVRRCRRKLQCFDLRRDGMFALISAESSANRANQDVHTRPEQNSAHLPAPPSSSSPSLLLLLALLSFDVNGRKIKASRNKMKLLNDGS